jgi:catechol 2,3-dioxygenase-like lactoylglutathione lyase family enzyme
MLSNAPVNATLQCRRKNLKAVADFYAKKLGLELAFGSPKEGFLVFHAGRRTELLLFESDAQKSDDTGATFEVKNLARAMAALRKKGVKFVEYDLPGVKTEEGVARMGPHSMCWLKDPDGNVLGLHQGA